MWLQIVLVSLKHLSHTQCALIGEVVRNSCQRIFFKVKKKGIQECFNEQQRVIYKLLINAENLNPSVITVMTQGMNKIVFFQNEVTLPENFHSFHSQMIFICQIISRILVKNLNQGHSFSYRVILFFLSLELKLKWLSRDT